ncbi:hypothetical protein D3C85_1312720 [compost metagenome]
MTGLDGSRRAAVRLQRSLVLLGARDVVLLGHVLGRDAHVDGVERVVQRAEHHVDELGIAHARAPARHRRQVRRAAHALRATADGHVGIAEQDGLGGADDGLEARTAETVHSQCGGVDRHPAVHGRHAAQVHVFRFGLDHIAEYHVADVVAGHVGAGQCLAHDQRAQIGRGHVLQAAAEGADCGAHTADNHHFTRHVLSP